MQITFKHNVYRARAEQVPISTDFKRCACVFEQKTDHRTVINHDRRAVFIICDVVFIVILFISPWEGLSLNESPVI